jgi:hypothetical protein
MMRTTATTAPMIESLLSIIKSSPPLGAVAGGAGPLEGKTRQQTCAAGLYYTSARSKGPQAIVLVTPSPEIGWTRISSIRVRRISSIGVGRISSIGVRRISSIGVRRISSIGVRRISSIGIWISIVSTSIGSTINPANVPTVGSIVLCISL